MYVYMATCTHVVTGRKTFKELSKLDVLLIFKP